MLSGLWSFGFFIKDRNKIYFIKQPLVAFFFYLSLTLVWGVAIIQVGT